MLIKEVLCTETKQMLTIEEVAQHEKHAEIKKSLQCSTKGCEAKISFVSGTTGRSDHFRTVMHSEHSSDCYIQRQAEELRARVKYRETVEGSLDPKSTVRGIMYLFNKVNKPNKPKISKPRKTKEVSSSTKDTTGVNVTLGKPGAPSVEEIKETKGNVSFRVPSRQLNQISEAEEKKFIRLAARINKVKTTEKGFELDLAWGNARARLIINESFLKSSKDVQIAEYLKSLATFVDTKKGNYEVSVYTYCMFDSYKGNETIIYASDVEKFFISVSGKHEKPRRLASFQASFITGVWSK